MVFLIGSVDGLSYFFNNFQIFYFLTEIICKSHKAANLKSISVEFYCPNQQKTYWSLLMNYFPLKVLSQGDEKGFQKSVKILGFQMKITVSLVREYQDYLSDCGSDVYKVLIHLQRLV
jgi:hypothetical protein